MEQVIFKYLRAEPEDHSFLMVGGHCCCYCLFGTVAMVTQALIHRSNEAQTVYLMLFNQEHFHGKVVEVLEEVPGVLEQVSFVHWEIREITEVHEEVPDVVVIQEQLFKELEDVQIVLRA